ncbi:hypothetical protein Pcac1_g29296 [Phytophthora cactorum]|nr:hypothetical protein Pcac1_g29296 [Phytophthora cactorum]
MATSDCLELVKAIYGLKQASRVWNETFDEFVCSIGFQCRPSTRASNIQGGGRSLRARAGVCGRCA